MPKSLFEVEHSTDFQNSLIKFSDLQDFYTRMIIVADDNRKREFMQKMQSEFPRV
jgi:short-subunit dehydrogenase involved in D-alanine esterification of teichoic acids